MSECKERFPGTGTQEELIPGKTENPSSSLHRSGEAAHLDDPIGRGAQQRGRRAGFDPETGAVSGSGSNVGGGGAPGEDYDQDSAGGAARGRSAASMTDRAGSGHPLPESEDARHDEIPESIEARKGEGDDGPAAEPASRKVNPDGKSYPAGDRRGMK